MKKAFVFLLPLLFLGITLSAQRPPETESEYDKAYKLRVQRETINGVYIPADLGDAFAQLHQLIDRESKDKFRKANEVEAVSKLHFSLGRWMIINWHFYQGSRLSHSLKGMGLHHPDDMATFIIRSYHRSLNKVPIDAKLQIEELVTAREEERRARLQRGQVIQETITPAGSGGDQR